METETLPIEPIQKAVNQSDEKEYQSNNIIKRYTLIASGASLVPYDFVDVATSTITQGLMIKELCQIYNVPFSEKKMNVILWSATGSMIVKGISMAVKSVIEQTGSQGELDLTGAAVTGIYTAIIGEYYKLHLRDGGSLDDVNITDFGNYFIEEIKQGDLSIATFTNPTTLFNHLSS